MSARLAGLALFALTGCYEYDRVEWVIDTSAHSATVRLADLRSGQERDSSQLNSVLSGLVQGTGIEERFPGAEVVRKELVPNGDQLDFVASLRIDDPSDLLLARWDERRGWRFCPSEPGMVIVESNAAWRDAAGCVVWRRSARVLRVIERQPTPASPFSLLSAYQDWETQGRPMPETAPAQ